MNWYKKSQKFWHTKCKEQGIEVSDEMKDHINKMFGFGKYKPKPTKKKEKKEECSDCCHSLDPHCDGGDDGW